MAWGGNAACGASVLGVPALAPNWMYVQHRLGHMHRRERDNQLYHQLFQFPDQVTGLHRYWMPAAGRRVSAEEADLPTLLESGERALVVFTSVSQ